MRLDGIRALVLIICLPTFPAHPAAWAFMSVTAELAHHPRAAHFFLSLEVLEPSCEVDPGAHPSSSSSRLLHRRPPTAALRPCFCSAGRQSRPSHDPKVSGFRELFLAGPTEIIVLGHGSLPSALRLLDNVALHPAEDAQ